MRRLPLLLLALVAGCAENRGMQEPSSHVERVLQDVTAMTEGMAAAHSESRVVLRGPEYRSSSPRGSE